MVGRQFVILPTINETPGRSICPGLLLFIFFFLISCQKQSKPGEKELNIFRKVPKDYSGIDFMNVLRETEQNNILKFPYFYNGGGVAIGDLNNDGLPDIYFTGNMSGDRLYMNKGDLKFEDVTKKSGILKANLWTTGVSLVDINSDGWLDIYVCRSGLGTYRNNLLYINQKNGRFVQQAKDYGLADNGYSVQSYFFDYDLDGDLDMYLVNHSVKFFSSQEELFKLKGKPTENEADKLYQNTGNETFKEVGHAAGIRHFAFGLSASVADFNDDGYPDIYVANDFFEPDYLYYNNRDGTFSDVLSETMGHISFSSMGSDAADFNNDGFTDIMVCDMQASDNFRKKVNMASMDVQRFERMIKEGYHYQYMRNTLQLNSGMGRFSEIAELSEVAETDWSWGPLFLDMNNDGWKDLFVSNGIRRDIQYKDIYLDIRKKGLKESELSAVDVIKRFPVYRNKNYSFQNNRDMTFDDQTGIWGIDFEGFTTGAAYGDLDRDGDLDVVLNNLDDEASVYENTSIQHDRKKSNYLQIVLKGNEENPMATGATVRVRSDGIVQHQYLQPTRGFQSCSESIIHFGLDSLSKVDEMLVRWADGSYTTKHNFKANTRIEIYQDEKTFGKNEEISAAALFTNQTDKLRLDYVHREEVYDDYEREILLPHKYSQLGPAIAVDDVNADDLDDFYIGGAKGQPGQLYLQLRNGNFKPFSVATWTEDKGYEDTGALFFDADNDGDLDLYIASGSNEWLAGSEMYRDRFYENTGESGFIKRTQAIPDMRISSQVVKAGDFDKDGDLDLFVGGRLKPGHYPVAPTSRILSNQGGKFLDKTEEVAPEIHQIGMVTDALWVDFDSDQDLDLMLAGEWMPLTLFENKDGMLSLSSFDALENTNGWWYSLACADMDLDGDLDFIAGNLGKNYKYKASDEEPFEVYSNDFDDNGTLDIVLGYHEEDKVFPLRGKQCSSQQMPFIKDKFSSYAAFASSDITQVYGQEKLNRSYHLKAYTFASVYIENLGGGQFHLEELPLAAQLSSVNGIVIEDFNTDGFLDILLAGNMYHSEAETARNDAGIGLLLKGDGKNNFEPVSAYSSGFLAPWDVKGLRKLKRSNSSLMILVANNNDRLQFFGTNIP